MLLLLILDMRSSNLERLKFQKKVFTKLPNVLGIPVVFRSSLIHVANGINSTFIHLSHCRHWTLELHPLKWASHSGPVEGVGQLSCFFAFDQINLILSHEIFVGLFPATSQLMHGNEVHLSLLPLSILLENTQEAPLLRGGVSQCLKVVEKVDFQDQDYRLSVAGNFTCS